MPVYDISWRHWLRYFISIYAASLFICDIFINPTIPADFTRRYNNKLVLRSELKFKISAAPMVEYWPVALTYRQNNKHHTANLHSDKRLNLVMTPAAFRSIGDLYTFIKMLQAHSRASRRRHMLAGATRRSELSLLMPRKKMTTLYRSSLHSHILRSHAFSWKSW